MSVRPEEPQPLRELLIGIGSGFLGTALGRALAPHGIKEPNLQAVLEGLGGHATTVLEQLRPYLADFAEPRAGETTVVLDARINDAGAGSCGNALLALEQRFLLAAALYALHGSGQDPEDVQLREVLSKKEVQKLPLSEGLHELAKVVGDLEVVQATIGSLGLKVQPRHRAPKPAVNWWDRTISILTIATSLVGIHAAYNAGQTDSTVVIIKNVHESTTIEVPLLPASDWPKEAEKCLNPLPEQVDVKTVASIQAEGGN